MQMQAFNSTFAGQRLRSRAFQPASSSRGSLVVTNAITRQKKEEIVKTLHEKLDSSTVVFGIKYSKMDVATLQKFRKGMPPKSSVMVAKNTLMRVACKDRPKWSTVAEKGCKGENAWVFVDEDEIADVIKHYFKFESALFDDVKKQAPKGVTPERPTELRVAVMDSKYLSTEELKKCENLPNKKQLYGQIAGMLTQPTRKIATGVKMVPTKLAIAIKKLAELDEDKTKTVAVAAAAKASAQPSA